MPRNNRREITLDAEQKKQVDMDYERELVRAEVAEPTRRQGLRIECVRIAKEVLMENQRRKPASEAADLTEAGITGFAGALFNYVVEEGGA